MKRCFLLLIIFAVSLLAAAQTQTTYIRAGHLFDGASDSLQSGVIIIVEGERIARVVAEGKFAIPPGAKVVDLSQATVLPGLIDCHTHLTARADRYAEIEKFHETAFRDAFNGVINARKTLLAGFTTVRDVGSAPFAAVDLRDEINAGFLIGPRVVASGPGISITGGHGDLNNFAPWVPDRGSQYYPAERDYRLADGVDQVRRAVRGQLKYGVDVIKVHATGGVLSKGDSPGAPSFTLEELKAAVEEAHNAGRKVAAHAHGAQGIRNAILAGIDSIEHASLVDDEGIRLARERGTYFVMDVYNDDYLLGDAIKNGLPAENLEKEKQVGRLQRENFEKAFKAGVKMAFGTDAGVYPHGDNARQFAIMVKYGMTPAQAIHAATTSAADLIGRSTDVGSIAAGKYADLIAVSTDPLADVRSLEHVGFVMKGGAIYKDELTGKNLATLPY